MEIYDPGLDASTVRSVPTYRTINSPIGAPRSATNSVTRNVAYLTFQATSLGPRLRGEAGRKQWKLASLVDTSQGKLAMKSAAERKAFVIEAFDTLFNKRDYKAAEAYWSQNYIQHSAHIPPGREGLFNLVKSLPAELRHEPGLAVAEGDFVFLHGRFSGNGQPRALITIDIVKLADGVLAEHWDVWQDEVSEKESKSGLPMFGTKFPD
jgi:predicted SnoaL-like aldol condensation-catalyzing enzyme